MHLAPKISGRDLRRSLQGTVPAVASLLNNDRVSQQKITALEQWRDHLESMTRWQRVKWLLGLGE